MTPDTLKGFRRVERDDRLFDILPKSETKEKGVELWEKWTDHTVELIRIRQGQTKPTHHALKRDQVEQALKTYSKITLFSERQ